MTEEQKAEEYLTRTVCQGCRNICEGDCAYAKPVRQAFIDGYHECQKEHEWHSPEEHIDKDRVVLGIIKLCNKTRYSLVQWNGEWWYQYGSFNAGVRLIAWCEIPTFDKE